MVQLYYGPGSPQNADEDAALEFSNTVIEMDNWLCGKQTIQLWDWDGTTYIHQPDRVEQLDCTAREAEEAMWAGDFETAADRYEAFIEQYANRWAEYVDCLSTSYSSCGYGLWTQVYLYFQGRRIIAYALLGNSTRVRQLLNEAASTAYPDAFMEALLGANSIDVETICQAAYDYFSDYRPRSDHNYNPLLPGEIHPDINDGWNHTAGYRVNPARAGCDISLFSDIPTPVPTVTPTPYPTFAPPTPDTRPVEQQWIDGQFIYSAFEAGDYETALLIVQQAVPVDAFDEGRWSYWRALVYEALGRPDDALNEYISLYLNYPGSWWAWLAGLHLERIET